jgi:elongation factor Tu
MTLPPLEAVEPELWMTAENIFHIPGRGTVVAGRLEGSGLLSRGDSLVCDGQHWLVVGIETGQNRLQTAGAGAHVGVLLKNGPPSEVLRGKKLLFEPSARKVKQAARANRVGGKLRRRQG